MTDIFEMGIIRPLLICIFIVLLISVSYRYEFNNIIIDAISVLTAIFGVYFIWYEFREAKRISEAEFIVNLNSEFYSEKIQTAYNFIDTESDDDQINYLLEQDPIKKQELSNINLDNAKELTPFFTFFETIYLLIDKKIVDISIIDDLFAYRFFNGTNNVFIQDYKIVNYKETYQNIYSLHKLWRDYRIDMGKDIFYPDFCLSFYYDMDNDAFECRRVDESALNDVLTLQDKVIAQINNKEIFYKGSKERLLEVFRDVKNINLGIYHKKSGLLIGFSSLTDATFAEDMYFETDKFAEVDKDDVMYYRTVFVDRDYKGNNIQAQVTKIFKQYCMVTKKKIIVATVHKDNKWSSFFVLIYFEFIRTGL